MALNIRIAEPADYEASASVIQQVHRGQTTSRYLAWKYNERPAGSGFLVVATKDNCIIGTCGAVPVRLTYRGQEYRTWMVTDDGVLPAHRGQGIYRGMGELRLKLLSEAKCAGYWGFSGVMSRSIHTRVFGMTELGMVPWFWAPTTSIGTLLFAKLRPQERAECGRIDPSRRPPDQDASLAMAEFHRQLQQYDDDYIRVHKDRQYLTWRYLNHPTNRYGVQHYGSAETTVIWRGRSIVDYAGVASEAAKALRDLKCKLADEGHLDCYVYFQGSSEFVDALKRAGFRDHHSALSRHVERQRVASPRWLIVTPMDMQELPLLDMSRWALLTGDHGEMA